MNRRLLFTLALLCAVPAMAHAFNAGDLRIVHPYATPSRPGMPDLFIHFIQAS